MTNKQRRHDAIRNLLNTLELGSQGEIVTQLIALGFKATQASVSQDLHQLKAIRVNTPNGTRRYVLPDHELYNRVSGGDAPTLRPSTSRIIKRIDIARNLAVVHTRPGYAMAVATQIEEEQPAGMLGTVAGYDTVLIVFRPGADINEAIERIK